MERTLPSLQFWRLSPLALPMLLPLCDPAAGASGVSEASRIDRAVAEFTGAATGTPGGARMAADPRLRLAPCGGALGVRWHNPARTAVQVECPGPESWRIFIAINPAQASASAGPAAHASPAVKRGDAVTLVVRGRGFSVQQSAEAMESGAVGDWIFLRTSRKAESLRARIERPGLVVIPAS